jgi:2-oxoglutarate ferredoxin oxidoreductase subunit gamma
MDGTAGADSMTDRVAGADVRAHEIILGGFGGQGIKVISSLLAQAAHEAGRHAMMYNIYAAAIRGGPIFCTVIVADRPPAGGPTTTAPTAVLAMDPNTVDVYEGTIRPGGTLVVNSSLVTRPPRRDDLNVVRVPTNEIAEEIGDIRYTGMVGLGALIEHTGVVRIDTVLRCLEKTLPAYRHHMIPANEQALRRGAACQGSLARSA